MKNDLIRAMMKLVCIWAVSCLVMMAAKPFFLASYIDRAAEGTGFWSSLLQLWVHGFRMDSSVAAYISIIPAILLCVSLACSSRLTPVIEKIYYALISLTLGGIFVVDTILYRYWGFKLDMTPLFYFTSSPGSALASANGVELIAGPVVWMTTSALIYLIYRFTVIRFKPCLTHSKTGRKVYLAVMLVFSTLLVIPLRGGLTVSTTNMSSSYFSTDQILNHSAVNPAFSLLYSATHQTDFKSQFHFMDDSEADKIVGTLLNSDSVTNDTVKWLSTDRPDVYIIILESFSSHLFPSLGGEEIAVKLDSIGKEGIMFTNFYASGFRTDRGIPAILSGFPAQPTTSVMKFVDKAAKLPSIASALDRAGYTSEYFYGGDAEFTNMKAYLVNTGFSRILSDKDFSIGEKMSKWGAHDDVLLRRVFEEVKSTDAVTPRLRVIQTSSSHEPFKVPYANPKFRDNGKANAFAYTDSCVADFVMSLSEMPRWDKTLILLVPDHYGAYPEAEKLPELTQRHKIPLIMTGGALTQRRLRMTNTAGQTDIPATLLTMLGLNHGDFRYSINVLESVPDHVVYISGRNEIGLIGQKVKEIYNIETGQNVLSKGMAGDSDNKLLKAYIQTIYNTISEL